MSASEEALEELAAEYLGRLEHEPGLLPEDFAAGQGADASALLRRIRAALRVQQMLGSSRLPAPEQIGPYRIGALLGRGGMGVVHAAERDGRRFALKLLPPDLAATARAHERFRREARVLARLAHPGIVRIHDTGVFQGAPYLVMELIEGRNLAQVTLPLAPERAARIVRALALAVDAAHAAGMLHRDIKPSNVILRADDEPVLLDFGLGAGEEEVSLTSSGALLGTPRYMAPEQAAGLGAERASDVHGLGLILFELLHGTPARAAGSRAEVLARARRVSPSARGGVPAPLARILASTLALVPRRRPAAATLAAELGNYLAGRTVHVHGPRAHERLGDALRAHPLRAVALLVGGALGLFGLRQVLIAAAPARAEAQATLLAERVRAALAEGRHDEGVALALRAAETFAQAGGEAAVELPRLLALAEARPETLAALERRVADGDGRALVHFALAYALDSAHRLPAAAAAYERVLEVEPAHVRARLNLAHLYAGAQLGACQACDRAYAEAPDMLAPARALAQLEQALALDRGAGELCVPRAIQSALDLAARAPTAGAVAFVAARLEQLLGQPAATPGARRRLEEGLARLRSAGGR